MTTDEAIMWLTSLQNFFKEDSEQYVSLGMAIEALKEYDKVSDALNGYVELYRKLKEKYDNLKKQNQWIPCSERLPEEDGQYLITVKYVHVDGYEDIYAEHGDWADGKWDMFCFGHCGKVESILAWMPLPKPYEGGAND